MTTQHIVTRGPNDELLEWWWIPQASWQLVDLSARVGGQRIAGDPHGYVLGIGGLNPVVTPGFVTTQHIVTRGPNDELLEWWWIPQASWQLVDLSARLVVGNGLLATRTAIPSASGPGARWPLGTSWRRVPVTSYWSGGGMHRRAGNWWTYPLGWVGDELLANRAAMCSPPAGTPSASWREVPIASYWSGGGLHRVGGKWHCINSF